MKPLIIAHPAAERSGLFKRICEQIEAEVALSRWAGHSRELAAGAEEGRVVYAAGGDGTLHEIINGLMSGSRQRPRVGLIPLGTGNDVARSLRIPFDETGILEMCRHPRWRDLDLGRLSGVDGASTYFVSSATIGFTAQTSTTARRLRGFVPRSLLFLAAALCDMVTYRPRGWGRCGTEQTTVEMQRLFNVNLANLELYGRGMIAAPGACGWSGSLDLVTMDLSRLGALAALPETYRGRFHRVRGVTHLPFRSVLIESEVPRRVQADGEPWGFTPVRCEVVPGAISFMLPDDRP